MATKLAFRDDHPCDFPEAFTMDGDRYLKAVYILNDTAIDEDSTECDYGVFNCGFGDDTLNKGKHFGKSWESGQPKSKKVVVKVREGSTQYRKMKMLRYPDSLQWLIHKEVDGEVWLYKPQKIEPHCYGRGTKAYNVTGWTYDMILNNCYKEGFNGNEVRQREGIKTRPIGPRTGLGIDKEVMWCKEFDGKSIIPLVASRPKMTMTEIINVIVNEGGSVDENLIVHAPRA